MSNKITYQIGFTADTIQLKKNLQSVVEQLDKIGSKPNNRLNKELQDASDAALKLSSILKYAFNQNTGKLDLSKFQQQLNNSGKTLKDYSESLNKLGIQGQQAFLKTAQSIMTAERPIRRVSKLTDDLWESMKKTARWQIGNTVLNSLSGAIQTAYHYSQDLNKSLNNIRIVTGKNIEQMDKFAEKANKAARELSATTLDYTNSSLIYAQQGLDDEQIEARTAITLKAAQVSRQSAEEVSNQLTAIWNNFYDGSQSLEYYADVITALGAATASSSEEISTGLEKFAAVADTVGLSYEYATSALATITATTRQSAEIVGTALRTVFARIQGLKLGETLEDGTSLNKYSEALKSVGINIFEQNGELKEMDTILDEMGTKWQTLSAAQQSALAQTVGGVRQYNQIIALMDNWDFMQENLATARSSGGTLSEQQEIYAESWEAASDRVRAAAEKIYSSLISDDFFIDLLNGTEKFLGGINTVINSLGNLDGILAIAFGAMAKLYGPQMAQGLSNITYMVSDLLGFEQKKADALKDEAASLTANMRTLSAENELELDLAKRKMELQKNINDNSKKYSEEKKISIALQQQELEVLERQTLELTKQADAQKKNVFNLEGDLFDRMEPLDSENFDAIQYFADIDDIVKRGTKKYWDLNKGNEGTISKIAGIAESTSLSDDEKYAEMLGEVINQTKRYTVELQKRKEVSEKIKNITAESDGKITENNKELIRTLLEETSLLDKVPMEINEIEGAIVDLNNSLSMKETSKVSVQLQQLFSLFGIGREQSRQYISALLEMYDIETLSKMSKEELTEAFKKVNEEAGKTDNLRSWNEVIVSAAGSLTSLYGAWQAIQNVNNVFRDEDASTGEKISAVISALTTSTFALGSARETLTKISQTSLVTDSKNIVVSKLLATAKSKEASAFAASAASAGAGLVAILPYIAAAAALAGVIYLLVKRYNQQAEAAKKAKEAAEKAREEAEKAKAVADDLRSSIDAYDSAIEKLESCTKHTKEWKEALVEVNKAALNVLNNVGSLSIDEIKELRNSDGTLNKEALEQLQTRAGSFASNASYTAAVAQKKAVDEDVLLQAINLARKIEVPGIEFDDIQADFIIKNLEELASLSKDKLIAAFENRGYILNEEVKRTLFPTIKKMAEQAEAAAEKLNLISQLEVSSFTGGNDGTSRSILIERSATANLQRTAESFPKTLETMWFSNSSNINKYSGADNEIYQKVLEELNKIGYNLSAYYANPVQGNYGNLGLYFVNSDGEIVSFSQQEVAKKVGVAQAREQVGARVSESKEALDKISDTGIDYLYDEDFSNSTKSFLNSIIESANFENDVFGTSVDENLLKSLGYDSKDTFISDAQLAAEEQLKAFNTLGDDYSSSMRKAISKINPDDLTFNEYQEIVNVFLLAAKQGKLWAAQEAYNAGKLEEFSEGLNAASESLKDFSSKWLEINKIISNLSTGDTISTEDYLKLEKDSKKYFTAMLDGTYKLTGSAEELKKETQDLMIGQAQEQRAKIQKDIFQEQSNRGRYNFINSNNNNESVKAQNYLKLLRDYGPDNDLDYAKKLEEWTKRYEDNPIDDTFLNELDTALKEVIPDISTFSQEIQNSQNQLKSMDLAIASSYDNISDLKQAYEDGIIKDVQALNTAILNLQTAEDEKFFDPEEVKDYAEYLEEAGKELGNFEDMDDKQLKNFSKSVIRMNKGAEEIIKNFEQWEKVLKKSSKGSLEYSKAIDETRSAVANLLNISEEYVSNDFIEQHFDKIQKAAEGNIESLKELKTEIGSFTLDKILAENGITEEEKEGIKNTYRDLMGALSEIKAGKIDDSSIKDFLNELLTNTKMTVDQANALFASLNLSVDYKKTPVETDIMVPEYTTETQIVERDSESGTPTKTKSVTYQTNSLSMKGYTELLAMSADGTAPEITGVTKLPSANFLNSQSTKKSGGSKKVEKKDSVKTDLRYRKIDREINSTARSIDRLGTSADRTFGTNKIDILNNKVKELNKQTELYKQRLIEANKYLKEDLEEIKKLGLTPIIDSEGEIANYDELVRAIDAAYNEEIEKYNKMSAAQQEKHKERMDQLQEEHDKQIEALEQYIETLDERNDTEDEIITAQQEAWDAALEAANAELKIVLKIKDARREIAELNKSIAESTGDYLSHGNELLNQDYDQVKYIQDNIGVFESTYNELMSLLNMPGADTEALTDSLLELSSNAIDSAEELLEFLQVVKEHFPNAVDAARERFQYFLDTFEHNNSILETAKELMVLQGATIKTAKGFAELEKIGNAQLETQRAAAVANRRWYEEASARLAEAEAELANSQMGTHQYDIVKGIRDSLLEEMREAESAMFDSAANSMEIIREMFENAIEKALYSFEQKISNNQGIDLLQQKYDNLISAENRYLDDVNKLFQLEELTLKIQGDIDKSQGQYSINRLRELQEEIALKEKSGKLSAYDLEILNAKYQMTLAQIALDEAQNSKSQVRLARDSNGNWNYQFTADQSQINQAQMDYNKAVNDYYNIAKKRAEETSGDIIALKEELLDKMRDLYLDETLTEEERNARLVELQKYYTEQYNYLQEQKANAIRDASEAGKIATEEFETTYLDSLDELTNSALDFEAEMENLIAEMNQCLMEYENTIDAVATEAGVDYDTLSQKIVETTTKTQEFRDASLSAIDAIWGELDKIRQVSMEYANLADSIMESVYALQRLAAQTANSVQGISQGNGTGGYINADYSMLMATYLDSSPEHSVDDAAFKELQRQREAKIAALKAQGKGVEYYRFEGQDTIDYFSYYNGGFPTYSDEEYRRLMQQANISAFGTGGFTGNWGENGKLAFLHEKELVLNQDDTQNILKTVETVRSFGDGMFKQIAQVLTNEAQLSQMFSRITSVPFSFTPSDKTIEQNVSIEATFPGVQTAAEIDIALTSLVNRAAQKAAIAFE